MKPAEFTDMNDKKKAYEEEVEGRIKEYRAESEKLKAKAQQHEEDDTKIELNAKIEGLESEIDSLEKKADEIRNSTGDAWQDLQTGFTDALDRLTESVRDARSNF